MAEQYNQQDGGAATQPDSNEVVSDPNNARPATIGERKTEPGTAGQGLGQIAGGERADSSATTDEQDSEIASKGKVTKK